MQYLCCELAHLQQQGSFEPLTVADVAHTKWRLHIAGELENYIELQRQVRVDLLVAVVWQSRRLADCFTQQVAGVLVCWACAGGTPSEARQAAEAVLSCAAQHVAPGRESQVPWCVCLAVDAACRASLQHTSSPATHSRQLASGPRQWRPSSRHSSSCHPTVGCNSRCVAATPNRPAVRQAALTSQHNTLSTPPGGLS
jgi:hypothetical protein